MSDFKCFTLFDTQHVVGHIIRVREAVAYVKPVGNGTCVVETADGPWTGQPFTRAVPENYDSETDLFAGLCESFPGASAAAHGWLYEQAAQ